MALERLPAKGPFRVVGAVHFIDENGVWRSVPITGFFGVFHGLCPGDTVLTENPDQSDRDRQEHVMKNALVCSSIAGPYKPFNTIESVVVSREIGQQGFFSGSYANSRMDLNVPRNHLFWNVLLHCARTNDEPKDSFFSEPEACHQCVLENGDRLQLGCYLYLFTRRSPHTRPRLPVG